MSPAERYDSAESRARKRARRGDFPGEPFWGWWADSCADNASRAALAAMRHEPRWLAPDPVRRVKR